MNEKSKRTNIIFTFYCSNILVFVLSYYMYASLRSEFRFMMSVMISA